MVVAQDTTFWQDRAAAALLQIAAYEAAMLAFATDGAQQKYDFDTGQTEIRVERANLSTMQNIVSRLIAQHGIYCQRAGLSKGGHQSRPAC